MAPPIPLDPADLTPEWLTYAWRARHPEAPAVDAVEVIDAHSGTTGRVKLRLTFAGGADPTTVFCKIAPFDERQRGFLRHTGIGAMEARFFATFADEIPVRIPALVHAETDEAGGFVIVIEDLDASGCTYPRPEDDGAAERAAATLRELAALHGAYWQSPRLDGGDLEWVPDRAGFGPGGGKDPAAAAAAGQFIHMAMQRFAGDMPKAFREVGHLYVEHTAAVLDAWDEGPRTLIHGDTHSGNLFEDRGRPGFYDWAMFSHSPGMRDVAYYCCQSIPAQVRRSEHDALLTAYRDALGPQRLDAPSAERQFRLFAVFAWVSATSTAAMGSRWQPGDRAMAGMHRTTSALEDLDCAGLLREVVG